MKIAALLFGTTLIIGHHTQGATEDGSPIRWHSKNQSMIMRTSTKAAYILAPESPLDNAHTFNCESAAGCVIILNAAASFSRQATMALCPTVDGVKATPNCAPAVPQTYPLMARAMAVVGQGTHTVQTIVETSSNVLTAGWETDYTLYERR